MTVVRVFAAVATLVMVIAIGSGLAAGGLFDEGRAIWTLTWGKVTLVDLYLALALFGGWIALRERSPVRVVAWWLALAVTGSLAAAVYVLMASLRSSNSEDLMLGGGGRAS